MAANPHASMPVTKGAATGRLALIFGVVAFPVLAIALGIGITILVNALR